MPSIHYFQNTDTTKNRISYKNILFGTVTAVIFSLLLIVLASVILLYTNIPQRIIPVLSKIIMFMSVFMGGIVSGVKSNSGGWLGGALTGVAFFLLLYVIGMITGINAGFSYMILLFCVLCAIIGCIGGVFGINLKPKRKNRQKH